jgi:putative membrane protein
MSQALLTRFTSGSIVLSGLALLAGWLVIRRRRDVRLHRRLMLTATALAAVFLVAYVTRWSMYGSKPFAGTGAWRQAYLAILLPHVLLAIAVGPLALRMIYLAQRRRDFAAHRRLGRFTVPLWLFVSASGWVIYWLLYVKTF